MPNSLIFNYDEDKNITVAGYEIDSKLLNANRSPIATMNFNKNIGEVKSMADIFKGKIIPAGLFSSNHITNDITNNITNNNVNCSENNDGDILDDLKELIQRPNIALDKFSKKHSKTKKALLKRSKNRKTKRNK